jgi:hypothetical protein
LVNQLRFIEALEDRRLFSAELEPVAQVTSASTNDPQLIAPPPQPEPGKVIFQRCKPHVTTP